MKSIYQPAKSDRWFAMTKKCKWCRIEFTPRVAGRKQEFCDSQCKKIFERQLRDWAMDQVEKGEVDFLTLALNKRGKTMDDTSDGENTRKRNTSV